MTKAELIDQVAAKAGCTKKVAGEVIAAFTETVKGADKVTLVGFGTFEYRTSAEKKGRNPQTGKEMTIAAKRTLKFKPSKAK